MNFKQYNVQEIGLAKALVRKGYECGIVFYNGKNKDEIEYVPVECNGETREITVYKLHGYNVLKNGFFPSLRKITKEYDVIQVHEYDQITSWLYYAWSKKPVVIYHGPYYHEFNKGYNFKCKIFDNVFLRIRHNRDVLCMTKSELAANFLRKKGFLNVRTVGVGLDLERFSQLNEIIEELPINRNKKNVIYIGKIEERRNPFFLLQVMNELCKKNENVNCVIVGTGDPDYLGSFLKEADSMLESGKLQYYRDASQEQLAQLYRKADLMLFPSQYEIFGMVLLEAIHFQLPVITTKNGGSSWVEKNSKLGRVIPVLDVEVWISAIQSVLYENMLKQKVEDPVDVTWDALVESFIIVYKESIRDDK